LHSDIIEVAAGDVHALFRAKNGNVYAFGDGSNGCLGIGTQTSTLIPTYVSSLGGNTIVQLAAGDAFHNF
jgi:alpha-tubulin suppressor-like RCC1 family protein